MKKLIIGCWLLALAASAAQADTVDVRQQEVLDIFNYICEVPRYSSYEKKIGNWLMNWAEANGFAATRDAVGNVIIDVPATAGMENRERVVFQTHQDMVRAVKAGVSHDWKQEPIVPVVEDGWIHSANNETSLGADDGIGMATVLAIAKGDAPHGPLRLIMTVEEETSQVGVKELSPDTVADAKFLINVDFLQEGVVTISSACADINTFVRTPTCEDAPIGTYTVYKIEVSGLRGGHSGLDINDGRANAIIELGKMLDGLQADDLKLSSFAGGLAENAIPASATAVIMVPEAKSNAVSTAATAAQEEIRKGGDTEASVTVTEVDQPQKILSSDDCAALLNLITGLTNGVVKMSEVVPGLVQTSSNLGIVDVDAEAGRMRVGSMMRSSSEADYEELLQANGNLAKDLGFNWSHLKNCEIWPANPNGELLAICTNVYKAAFGNDISVIATHAGLECGTFKVKNPALDIISVGPTVLNEHSIAESCDFNSCLKVRNLLEGILFQIPERDNPLPVIDFFKTDFTAGPTSQVPNVSWKISGPFDRVALAIDEEPVYEGDTRCGEGRWRELSRPGIHRLKLTAGYGEEEVSVSGFYTALREDEEPVILPRVIEFYSDFYTGFEGDAPYVHWKVRDIVTMEIWVDQTRVLVTMEEEGKFRLTQLRIAGSHVVRIVARNVIEDAESSFVYFTKPREKPVSSSAPLRQHSETAPVINAFYPDAYDASIWETPFIHWGLGGEVDLLQLTIDNVPVFIGDGNLGNGRWLDVSGLNVDEMNGSHVVTLSVSNSLGVVTSNFTCTCYWEEPPPPPMGSEGNPWTVGENVQAYTNGFGGLVITGSGATSDFTGAADLPWAEVAGAIKAVALPEEVTVIGDNLWAGLGEGVVINGETIVRRREIVAGAPAETPSGAIAPAGAERIEIVNGKVHLGVSVSTNADLTVATEAWRQADIEDVKKEADGTVTLTVPATAEKGFMILKSKGK